MEVDAIEPEDGSRYCYTISVWLLQVAPVPIALVLRELGMVNSLALEDLTTQQKLQRVVGPVVADQQSAEKLENGLLTPLDIFNDCKPREAIII